MLQVYWFLPQVFFESDASIHAASSGQQLPWLQNGADSCFFMSSVAEVLRITCVRLAAVNAVTNPCLILAFFYVTAAMKRVKVSYLLVLLLLCSIFIFFKKIFLECGKYCLAVHPLDTWECFSFPVFSRQFYVNFELPLHWLTARGGVGMADKALVMSCYTYMHTYILTLISSLF